MKLVCDRINNNTVIILEGYAPSKEDSELMFDFCQRAMKEPEVVGGLYYLSIDGNNHLLELRQQGLFTLLLSAQYLGYKVPLTVTYEDVPAPDYFIKTALKIPMWLLHLGKMLGIVDKQFTYHDFLVKAYESNDPRISKTVRK